MMCQGKPHASPTSGAGGTACPSWATFYLSSLLPVRGMGPKQLCSQGASPCRRLWSESERRAGLGPPLRKIMASRPRKSAVRPVYSSPPRRDQSQERAPAPASSPIPPSAMSQLPPSWPALAWYHPPTKVLAKGRLGSCGQRPLPFSTLLGSKWSTC